MKVVEIEYNTSVTQSWQEKKRYEDNAANKGGKSQAS